MNQFKFRAMLFAIAVSCFAPSASAQEYSVTNLGGLTGFAYTNPHGINNSGEAVGEADSADFTQIHPFRTAANSVINPETDDLGLLAGAATGSAAGINSSGQVAGTDNFPIAGSPGFFYSIAFRADPGNSTLINLGTRNVNYLGTNISNANGINDSGQVAGAVSTEEAPPPSIFNGACNAEVESQSYRTTPDGLILGSDHLGSVQVANCGFSQAYGINNAGQVVGYSNLAGFFSGPIHASLATPGSQMQDLGTLNGYTGTSMASAINATGQIVGQSTVSTSSTHAFLVNSASSLTMDDLGSLGGSNSSATAINASGQIVGNSLLSGNSVIHAFLYANGVMTDLNSLIPSGSGWVLENATGINSLGQIVGTGTLNGVFAGYRLDPAGSAGISILISELANPALGLKTGETRALTVTLDVAMVLMRAGVPAAPGAALLLDAFVVEVDALQRAGQLSATAAAPLIAEAQNVIRNLP